mmetsp:Transcript_72227/g.209093  ORF Transcript_72227/g.209093 Transcript_72227/m.209093 type:complete len:225 (+) Transcript_72227:290-964(+)
MQGTASFRSANGDADAGGSHYHTGHGRRRDKALAALRPSHVRCNKACRHTANHHRCQNPDGETAKQGLRNIANAANSALRITRLNDPSLVAPRIKAFGHSEHLARGLCLIQVESRPCNHGRTCVDHVDDHHAHEAPEALVPLALAKGFFRGRPIPQHIRCKRDGRETQGRHSQNTDHHQSLHVLRQGVAGEVCSGSLDVKNQAPRIRKGAGRRAHIAESKDDEP